jgi:hypothetical protein
MSGSFSDRKSREWRRRLLRFEKHPSTIKEFCRREGVSEPSFYLWRKRLGLKDAQKPVPDEPPAGFRPVRLLTPESLVAHLPGGMRMVVPMSEPDGLRAVVDALARVDAELRVETRPC